MFQHDNTGYVPSYLAEPPIFSWVTESDTLVVSGDVDFALVSVVDSPVVMDDSGRRVSPLGFSGNTPTGDGVTCTKKGETYSQPLLESLLTTDADEYWSCNYSEEPRDIQSNYTFRLDAGYTGARTFGGSYDPNYDPTYNIIPVGVSQGNLKRLFGHSMGLI